MADGTLNKWLKSLGYAAEVGALHFSNGDIPAEHPYAPELARLLDGDGTIHAQAVFDVEGVPTVVFVSAAGGGPVGDADLDQLRQRLWNQNLASVVLSIHGNQARAFPINRSAGAPQKLTLADAGPSGPFSAAEIKSGDIQARLPSWFQIETRVNRHLLANLSVAVTKLESFRISRERAQALMGQVLFISYLEHRGIVSSTYRAKRKVSALHDLVRAADQQGISKLLTQLRKDFNGDFLAETADRPDPWPNLPGKAFITLSDFLSRVDLATGQQDFWNYDFSFIPVELLSGLYESFLGERDKGALAAFYTPRHLATLTIDQAFQDSAAPLDEVIFDGACGSGILLTTAFRRLIAMHEANKKSQLSFSERVSLLKGRIFGSDISEMACRVTAFSLYLSLIEGLKPSDILALQDHDQTKLPPLQGKNLLYGSNGDFFNTDHAWSGKSKFTLLISNPPWKEPKGKEQTSADRWALEAGAARARRQIAGDFSLRALDYLAPGGRVCLILPVSQILAPTSAGFLRDWLSRARPIRMINFGDLQQLLFDTASHTCFVVVASKRADRSSIAVDETFEYCAPKADISLSFGRLTLLSADRHRVQTISALSDNQLLVTLMWGDYLDISIWARLSERGTIDDFLSGPKAGRRWTARKGIHFEDSSVEAQSAEILKKMSFIEIEPLKLGVPVLHKDNLSKFPADVETVARINEENLATFNGPRVLFPDGFSKEEQEVRAVYFDGEASFSSSIGVIAGPKSDQKILRFLAIFLRSRLAKYFLVTRAYQMLCERNRVTIVDIASFPFFAPERAADPKLAQDILDEAAADSAALEAVSSLEQKNKYEQVRAKLDKLIYDYFGLNADERRIVDETVEVLLPSVRPRAYKSLRTPTQRRATMSHLKAYSKTLNSNLASWRSRLGGNGGFSVDVITEDPASIGPFAVVRVRAMDGSAASKVSLEVDAKAAVATVAALQKSALLPVEWSAP